MKSSNRGFTLVELSIVIVIVGLIIAGVTAGQTLVKQAQLRAILTQADQIRTAVNTFKSQYGGLPGDINNGSLYWSGCGVTGICDGNADKKIGTDLKNTDEQPEGYIAWWQLNAAGVFPGTFTIPAADAGDITGIIGTTIPAAKFPKAGITLGYDTNQLTGIAINKNIALFGAAAASTYAGAAFLLPAQASSLDVKADDGNAERGSIYGGAVADLAECEESGTYELGATTATCTIAFAL